MIILNEALENIKTYYINVFTIENNNLNKFNSELKKLENEGKGMEIYYEELNSKAKMYGKNATKWFTKDATNFWGKFDEDRWDSYQWEGRYCREEMNRLQKEAEPYKKKVKKFQNQREQIRVKINKAQIKLSKLNDLVNEKIFNCIQEELNKNKIILPTEIDSDKLKYFIKRK